MYYKYVKVVYIKVNYAKVTYISIYTYVNGEHITNIESSFKYYKIKTKIKNKIIIYNIYI